MVFTLLTNKGVLSVVQKHCVCDMIAIFFFTNYVHCHVKSIRVGWYTRPYAVQRTVTDKVKVNLFILSEARFLIVP